MPHASRFTHGGEKSDGHRVSLQDVGGILGIKSKVQVGGADKWLSDALARGIRARITASKLAGYTQRSGWRRLEIRTDFRLANHYPLPVMMCSTKV
jgi:hypothetical protein